MNRLKWLVPLFLFTFMTAIPSARAQDAGRRKMATTEGGPFVGLNLGVAEPTDGNYRAHVQTGGSGAPYFGYMFNDYLGLQGGLDFTFQPPDNDHFTANPPSAYFKQHGNENRTTTLLGYTVGPRLEIPLGDLLTLNGVAQGGGFTGLSGRLSHTAPGFSLGAGLDYNVTPEFAVGIFGKWNRAYMSPTPKDLGIQQVSGERFGKDIEWATAGIGMKWSFKEHAPPPPPPPPPPVAQAPPPPPPPTKQKIVLRAVHFDFNKSNIRPDARPVLDEAVQMLKQQGTVAVVVEGHTDSVGSDAYNMKLSHRRADAVKKYLESHGVAGSRIKTQGYGESRPVASNDTAEGRAQNRRVELHID